MINIDNNVILLLTAAINPARGTYSLPMDPKEREKIYLDVLRYYIFEQKEIKRIIFLESSAAALDKFYELAKEAENYKSIEIISIDQNTYYPESNERIGSTFLKSYFEVMLIKIGFDKSKLAKEVDYTVKMTGRIKLLNLSKILKHQKEPFDFLCDYKDHGYLIRRFFGNKTAEPYCDSRFFVARNRFLYECLEHLCNDYPINGFVLERGLYDYLNKRRSDSRIIKRFPLEPIFVGKRGHFKGEDYYSSFIYGNIVRKGRSISRALFPWLHI